MIEKELYKLIKKAIKRNEVPVAAIIVKNGKIISTGINNREIKNNVMGQVLFTAIMPYISADLVGMIAKKKNISENDAITKLYNSKLYATLEQEDTKVWQYSTDMLYLLFELEEKTGKIEFPDV